MKKFLMFLSVCLFSITAYAQEDHLTFKGISLDGPLDQFSSELKSKGFSTVDSGADYAIFEGDFGGEDCTITIFATPESKIVYQAVVKINESSWATLKSTYNEYKTLLRSKYGKGESYEDFESPYYEGDGYEMTAVRIGKCNYFTKYELTNGKIIVAITKIDKGSVLLYYTDSINDKIAKREKANQKLNDL